MATLTLNAGTASPLTIVCQRAGKAPPRMVGTKSYSDSGRERNSFRGQAKVIPILVSKISTADEAAIQAAVMNGVQIPCSGDILGNLQTLCSIDNVVSNMVPGLVDFWEMSFTVNEVNASTVLLKYAPGDTITGESFTRSTTGTYINSLGNIATAAINTKRDSHYLLTNTVRTLLLEGARTNNWTRSEELDNAVWVKTRASVTANATTAPDTASTADKLVEDASVTTDHYFERNLVAPSNSTNQTWSFFAKSAGRTWLYLRSLNKAGVFANTYVNLTTGALGTSSGAAQTIRVVPLNNAWFRFEVTFNASVGGSTPKFEIALATGDNGNTYTGDGVQGAYIWGLDNEVDASFASSYIPTAGATVSRSADSYSLPFTTPPQEMTGYTKAFEKGTSLVAGARLFEVSSAADASPRFFGYAPAGFYGTFHGNAANVASALLTAPAINDVNETAHRLYGDGSVDAAQSIAGAATTTSAQSAATPLGTAWSDLLSDLLVWLNSAGTTGSQGYIALQLFKIVAGARSLAEARAA